MASGYTQTQLDSLRAAIGLGVRTVRYGDKETTYQSLGEMRALEREMASQLEGRLPFKKFYSKHGSGF